MNYLVLLFRLLKNKSIITTIHMKYIKILIVIAIASISMSSTYDKDKLFEISKNIEIFLNVFKEVNANYVDEIDPSELMRTGIDAMVESLDPYTNYISETQVERYRISDDSKYQGVGISLVEIEDKVFIQNPMEGGPGHDAGLRAGDQLIEVNGSSIKGQSIEEVENQIKGAEGTPVRLTVRSKKTNDVETLSLDRGEVNIPNVPYAGFVEDNVGYIHLTTFTPNAAANIGKELKRLKRENPNLEGVILDLRFNGGGLLREAVAICNLFLPKDTEVVFTRGKIKSQDQSFSTRSLPIDLDLPVAVLINGNSASASEIVSGVIQDLDRGVVLGQRSFGKGLVQNTFEIGYNSRVKVTTSKYHIPSGRCIQGVEYKDGLPVDIPDDKRSKFKTKNKRTVLDGGGITPDIKLDEKTNPPFIKALQDQNKIFQFVNEFVKNIDSISDIESYKFNDYDQFKSFINDSNFEYETYGEKELKEFKNAIKGKSIESSLNTSINDLDKSIESTKRKNFEKYKQQVINEIEKEIISRFFYQKGRIQINLRNDSEVVEAIEVLKDQNRYKKILNK